MKVLFVLAIVICAVAAKPAPDQRITNGQNAARQQFPYQISMEWGILGIFQHICGGSIIGANLVLTAAHCITESPNLGGFRIIAGMLNLNENHADIQSRTVQTTFVHPDYAGGVNPHDIGLLRLSQNLDYTAAVQAILLPAAGVQPVGNTILSGWGSVSTTSTPNTPTNLQFAEIPVISLQDCASAFISLIGESGPLHEYNICTGPTGNRISACSGDSGGPLVQGNTVYGIVSWGLSPCGVEGAPSVFGGVSNYLSWINSYAS